MCFCMSLYVFICLYNKKSVIKTMLKDLYKIYILAVIFLKVYIFIRIQNMLCPFHSGVRGKSHTAVKRRTLVGWVCLSHTHSRTGDWQLSLLRLVAINQYFSPEPWFRYYCLAANLPIFPFDVLFLNSAEFLTEAFSSSYQRGGDSKLWHVISLYPELCWNWKEVVM